MTNTNIDTSEPTTDDGLGKRLEDAAGRAGEIKDKVVEQVGLRVDSLEALIKKHPLAALGVGFGIGYLIARLFHR